MCDFSPTHINYYLKLCTTAFLVEISQYIKFGDLTTIESDSYSADEDSRMMVANGPTETIPPVLFIDMPDNSEIGQERPLSNAEEDALLIESTSSLADWISNFIRRVILLLENLPEEGTDGTLRGGESEGKYLCLLSLLQRSLKSIPSSASRGCGR